MLVGGEGGCAHSRFNFGTSQQHISHTANSINYLCVWVSVHTGNHTDTLYSLRLL